MDKNTKIDMLKRVGERAFILWALLMWTINNFPTYGFLSGQQVHGYKGCPLYSPETCTEHVSLFRKILYLGGRHYLDDDHRFRRAWASFNNQHEWQLAPKRPTREEVLWWDIEKADFFRNGSIENLEDDLVKLHGIKYRNIFYDLLF